MNAPPTLTPKPRTLNIRDLAHFDALVADGARSMAGWHLQSLDLSGRSGALAALDPQGAVFLGCELEPRTAVALRSGGALIFPDLPGIPFDPYRGSLYTGAELYAGLGAGNYEGTPDGQIYAWSSRPELTDNLDATLATALHDHAIGRALDTAFRTEFAGRKTVGVMGAHAAARGTAGYDDAARLGRLLAQAGFVVATGGGPGSMEAANLGAYLSGATEEDFSRALRQLGRVPGYRPSVGAWARAAAAVVGQFPAGSVSVGIPTWFYGHEPPNLFATHIAKYFANALREAVLLARCDGGIIFLPGAAGTIQEVFQDACENYYAAPEVIAPMILVGRRYWSDELPVWPLLRRLAQDRAMAEHVHLVDNAADALALLQTASPRSTAGRG